MLIHATRDDTKFGGVVGNTITSFCHHTKGIGGGGFWPQATGIGRDVDTREGIAVKGQLINGTPHIVCQENSLIIGAGQRIGIQHIVLTSYELVVDIQRCRTGHTGQLGDITFYVIGLIGGQIGSHNIMPLAIAKILGDGGTNGARGETAARTHVKDELAVTIDRDRATRNHFKVKLITLIGFTVQSTRYCTGSGALTWRGGRGDGERGF